ncbi:MAG: hypothetical protein HND52_11590 [Ignavibacteriae bacterium]|nr:hypothetical protein [Ignavibacteriota bacterium]NOG98592.1 hypothetical protein [Ignavibacteriota bacterium]
MIIAMQVIGYMLVQSCSLPESFGDVNEPANAFIFYLVYGFSLLVVAFVSLLTFKFMIKPKEKSKEHIKRKILLDL